PARPRDRVPDQLRGPEQRLPPGRRHRDGPGSPARPGRAPRHACLLGLQGAAVLRLAAGQADRVGSRPGRGAGPGAAGAGRAAHRGRADDPRALPRRRQRAPLRVRPLHDRLPRGRARGAAVPGRGDGGMSVRLGGATVADEAIVSMVRGAVAGVPGARLDLPGRVSRRIPGLRGPVEWTVKGGAIGFDVDVCAAYGCVLPRLAVSVRDAVAEHVGAMTGLTVRVVDVTVTGIDRAGGER